MEEHFGWLCRGFGLMRWMSQTEVCKSVVYQVMKVVMCYVDDITELEARVSGGRATNEGKIKQGRENEECAQDSNFNLF